MNTTHRHNECTKLLVRVQYRARAVRTIHECADTQARTQYAHPPARARPPAACPNAHAHTCPPARRAPTRAHAHTCPPARTHARTCPRPPARPQAPQNAPLPGVEVETRTGVERAHSTYYMFTYHGSNVQDGASVRQRVRHNVMDTSRLRGTFGIWL